MILDLKFLPGQSVFWLFRREYDKTNTWSVAGPQLIGHLEVYLKAKGGIGVTCVAATPGGRWQADAEDCFLDGISAQTESDCRNSKKPKTSMNKAPKFQRITTDRTEPLFDPQEPFTLEELKSLHRKSEPTSGCSVCGSTDGHCCQLAHLAKANPDVGSWGYYCSCPRCSPQC